MNQVFHFEQDRFEVSMRFPIGNVKKYIEYINLELRRKILGRNINL